MDKTKNCLIIVYGVFLVQLIPFCVAIKGLINGESFWEFYFEIVFIIGIFVAIITSIILGISFIEDGINGLHTKKRR